ncbi:MAG: hypothetical protein J5872_02295 [Lachnospiraceae bacterium]|nr:hypothetical protein [Lachnospiraceae bacterium]
MKKILALLLTVVLCAGLLAACGDQEESKKGSKRNTEGKGTPTVTSGPDDTPTPDISTTPDVTPTPTPDPRRKLTEVKDRSGAFSLALPSDADIQQEDGLIIMETDDCYLEAYYLLDGFTGTIYDLNDFEEMIPSENTLIDALDVCYYDMKGAVQREKVNGKDCLIGPASDADVFTESGIATKYSRFYVYDCQDEYGIIVVWYYLKDVTYSEMTDADWDRDAFYIECAESLAQYHSPLSYKLRREVHYLDDGSTVDFLAKDGSIKEIETEVGGGLSLKPYGTQNVQFFFQHIEKYYTDAQYDTTYDVYYAMKDAYGAYLTIDDPEEDLGNVFFMMYGNVDGIDCEFHCYCAYGSYDDYWIFMMRRPEGQEDKGEEQLFYSILWSFRDIYMYKYR